MSIRAKIRETIRKNYPELKALVTGKMPAFVYGGEVEKETVPVFTFHEVVAEHFEEQLSYLKDNGYATLDASELLCCLSHPKENHAKKVVLTFDDGHISLWRNAYPLLKKYDLKAVVFICPGLVPDDHLYKGDTCLRKLCNWAEIKNMHDSGYVDFQSHSMYHDLVFTSSRLIDFYSPDFSSYYLGKRDTPVVLQHDDGFSMTNLWPFDVGRSEAFFGMPIFDHAPRYATEWAYAPSQAGVVRLRDFVASNGGTAFFTTKIWRKALTQEFIAHAKVEKSAIITGKDYQNVLEKDLVGAREVLEDKLTGKRVTHFCYPWFEATKASMKTAYACGYASIFLGEAADHLPDSLQIVTRVDGKYVFLLPGKLKKGLMRVISGVSFL